MSADFSAVVVAAGESQRFRSDPNYPNLETKNLIEWDSKPLFVHTIEALLKVCDFKEIALVVKKENEGAFKKGLGSLPEAAKERVRLVEGGARRMDSVRNGINSLSQVDYVAIHDGARPFLSSSFLDRLISKALRAEAVIPVLPVTETVKEVNSYGFVERSLDRSRIVRVQTPQIFNYKLIKEAHLKLANDSEEFTDDSMMLEKLGVDVETVLGDPMNIKVTIPSDLIQMGVKLGNA